MDKPKKSGAALFMYAVIAVTAVTSLICLGLYYGGIADNGSVLWSGKALTYNPEAFSLKKHTLDEIADVMAKSEVDHWINEIISLTSILFSLIWGQLPIFVITALAAMVFDAQFIVIQRYNRPRAERIITKKLKLKEKLV